MTTQQKYKSSEILDLSFPIDISKLKAKETVIRNEFSSLKTTAYDITCFSAVKFALKKVVETLLEEYPDYQVNIYAHRATTREKESKVFSKLKLVYSVNTKTQFVHVSVELLV